MTVIGIVLRKLIMTFDTQTSDTYAITRVPYEQAVVIISCSSTQWRQNYGDRGVHCTPKFRTCTPCTPQVKDLAHVKILSKRL